VWALCGQQVPGCSLSRWNVPFEASSSTSSDPAAVLTYTWNVSAPCDNCAICDPTNRTAHLPVTIVYTALASTVGS
jgi:hypothetical protein